MLDLVHGAWSILAREQKQALLLLLSSIPLGLVSLFVGLREGDALLAATGVTALVCASIATVFVGYTLLTLCYLLLKWLLSLPFTLVKWLLRARKSSTESEPLAETTPEPRDREERQDPDIGIDWIDLALLFWLGVAVLQIWLLVQRLT